MAGGLALARIFKGQPASDEILKEARNAVLALDA